MKKEVREIAEPFSELAICSVDCIHKSENKKSQEDVCAKIFKCYHRVYRCSSCYNPLFYVLAAACDLHRVDVAIQGKIVCPECRRVVDLKIIFLPPSMDHTSID